MEVGKSLCRFARDNPPKAMAEVSSKWKLDDRVTRAMGYLAWRANDGSNADWSDTESKPNKK